MYKIQNKKDSNVNFLSKLIHEINELIYKFKENYDAQKNLQDNSEENKLENNNHEMHRGMQSMQVEIVDKLKKSLNDMEILQNSKIFQDIFYGLALIVDNTVYATFDHELSIIWESFSLEKILFQKTTGYNILQEKINDILSDRNYNNQLMIIVYLMVLESFLLKKKIFSQEEKEKHQLLLNKIHEPTMAITEDKKIPYKIIYHNTGIKQTFIALLLFCLLIILVVSLFKRFLMKFILNNI